jgi:hypothetical protein
MKLHVKRFQKKSNEGPILFGVTFRIEVTPDEKTLSEKYGLDRELVFEATQQMNSHLPLRAEYTEYFKTPVEAAKAENERIVACDEIIRFLEAASQFDSEETHEFVVMRQY